MRCAGVAAFNFPFVIPAVTEAAGGAELTSLADPSAPPMGGIGHEEIFGLALTLGLLLFAVVTAIMLLRTRRRAAAQEAALHDDISALKAERDRMSTLLLSEPQVIVSWVAAGQEPEVVGDATLMALIPVHQRNLAFGSWLEPDDAIAIEDKVAALRAEGESFSMGVTMLSGRTLEAEGRAIGGSAILRFKDVGGIKRDHAELSARYHRLTAEFDSLHSLIETLETPVWTRDLGGELNFINPAYARAVEVADAADAVARGVELLDRTARANASRARGGGLVYAERVPAIVAGSRRAFDVLDVPTRRGSAGIGIDVTEAETMHAEIARMVDAHRRTLDQLATAVAIFGSDQKLTFYNTAYRSLWDLDAGFLDQSPADSAVLDQLRTARKLPEEQDYRQWKASLHEAYRAMEAKERFWHLPNGRTLRVVTDPNPQGGVTYLFDDVTERLDLKRRYEAMITVQRETLDNLTEAVAVFASDGCIRLHNPAFARLWQLSPAALAERPHIGTVIEWCRLLYDDDALWGALRATITGIEDRPSVSARLDRRDGSVIDCATVPLPDGATLVAFRDITDTVNVERVLRESNDALVAADRIKEDFVQHVSYELRSPLTNIIGFSHFLGDPATGPLTPKQHEYLGYITTSTNALLAIINDILDLATINAGVMELHLGTVDIHKTMTAAAEGIRDRLVKDHIILDIRAAPDAGSFIADERRVRQILFNLLANAVAFSPPGATVTLLADRRPDAVIFSVTDHGSGIPADMTDRVFEWFESHPLNSQHRGAGLGLSIVRSFVELHGGTVTLDSMVGRGTTVICTFPFERSLERTAA